MKIMVIRCDFGIVTIISIRYDEYRPTKKKTPPRGGLMTKKLLFAVPRKGLAAGFHR